MNVMVQADHWAECRAGQLEPGAFLEACKGLQSVQGNPNKTSKRTKLTLASVRGIIKNFIFIHLKSQSTDITTQLKKQRTKN